MPILFGAVTAAGGLFLFLWFRTVAGLPASRRPQFVRDTLFRRGVPALSVLLLAAGLFLLARESALAAAAGALAAVVIAALVIRFDRYSAGMRVMYDDYTRLKSANPDMDEPDVLFHLARRRYSAWSEDRVVELVAGKDVRSLILLMAISEHGVNPIGDWELYRSMRAKAARIAPEPK